MPMGEESLTPEAGTWLYLIEISWWEKANEYLSGKSLQPPGPIDNSRLTTSNASGELELTTNLPGNDFKAVSEEEWNGFVQRFGNEGPVLTAPQVPVEGQLMVQPYPLRIRLWRRSSDNPCGWMYLSQMSTVRDLVQYACDLAGVNEDEVQIWDYYNTRKYQRLDSELDKKCSDINLLPGQDVLVEEKDDNGEFSNESAISPFESVLPSPLSPSGFMPDMEGASNQVSTDESDNGRGRAGLQNLGNTCFMNSALQCLSHSPLFVPHFLNEDYWNEINEDNPLGNRGELARQYGELCHLLWKPGARTVTPRKFKVKIGQTAPQFTGYQQQDAQELLIFLLDGLHEDLNRVKQKPYIEYRDAEGRPDKVVADEHWSNYKRRNDSIVVDLFTGLYKSTLICPSCSHTSITFEPLVYLSLPLPDADAKLHRVRVVHCDGAHRVHHVSVRLRSESKISELEEQVAEELGFSDTGRLVTMFTSIVDTSSVESIVRNPNEPFRIYMEDRIVVCKLPEVHSDAHELAFLPVVHRMTVSEGGTRSFGTPFLVPFKGGRDSMDWDSLQRWIWQALAPYRERSKGDEGEIHNHDRKVVDAEATSDYKGDASTAKEGAPYELRLADRSGNAIEKPLLEVQGDTEVSVSLDWDKDKALAQGIDFVAIGRVEPSEQKREESPVLHLDKCIQAYTKPEKLEPSEAWYCPKCKQHVEASKQLELWTLPPLLVIHLKRFQYHRFMREKLDAFVDFPTEGLDFTPYVQGLSTSHQQAAPIYDLYGVVNHYGGLFGGHYTAYVKEFSTRKWLLFDDSSVSELESPESVKSSSAYLLFYKRRDVPESDLRSFSHHIASSSGEL